MLRLGLDAWPGLFLLPWIVQSVCPLPPVPLSCPAQSAVFTALQHCNRACSRVPGIYAVMTLPALGGWGVNQAGATAKELALSKGNLDVVELLAQAKGI